MSTYQYRLHLGDYSTFRIDLSTAYAIACAFEHEPRALTVYRDGSEILHFELGSSENIVDWAEAQDEDLRDNYPETDEEREQALEMLSLCDAIAAEAKRVSR